MPSEKRETGHSGGTWRMLMSDQRGPAHDDDLFPMPALSCSTTSCRSCPTSCRASRSADDKVFTLHLREGHKWSDGQPFTSEDFRYYWEDVANNPKLSPSGPNAALIVRGKPPHVDIVDPLTIRYSWDDPNPAFIPAIAAPQPLYIFMPAHYLEQFPRQICRCRQAGGQSQEGQGDELGRAARAHVAPVPAGEPEPSLARAVAQTARRRRPNNSSSSGTPTSTASTRPERNSRISTTS